MFQPPSATATMTAAAASTQPSLARRRDRAASRLTTVDASGAGGAGDGAADGAATAAAGAGACDGCRPASRSAWAAAISRGLSDAGGSAGSTVSRRAAADSPSSVELGVRVVAAREVLADGRHLVRVEHAGDEQRREIPDLVAGEVHGVGHGGPSAISSVAPPSSRRNATSASRTRLFTVPSGTPRRSAISDLREAAPVGELEGLALGLGQGGDGGVDLLAIEPAGDLAPDVGHRQRRGRGLPLALDGELGRRATAPDGVDGPVVDDRQQPRPHAATPGHVAVGAAPRPEERVLDHVLGEDVVGGDAACNSVGHRLVSLVQRVERLEATVGQPGQELLVGRDRREPRHGRRCEASVAHRGMRASAPIGSPSAPRHGIRVASRRTASTAAASTAAAGWTASTIA